LAMFGLRSVFAILQDMVQAFSLLKYGLCIILVFIGLELCISPWAQLPPSVGLTVIAAVFIICAVGSAGVEKKIEQEVSRQVSSSRQESPSASDELKSPGPSPVPVPRQPRASGSKCFNSG